LENLREKDHLVSPAVDGVIILGGSSECGTWDMDWIELAKDGNRWLALVNAVMNFRVP
jgi:hypothetical protein